MYIDYYMVLSDTKAEDTISKIVPVDDELTPSQFAYQLRNCKGRYTRWVLTS